MISYEPFFNTLHDKGITEYSLIFKHGLSANTIHRMDYCQTLQICQSQKAAIRLSGK